MLLQVSFDDFNLEKVKKIVIEIHQYIDILEVGTPLLLFEGINAIKFFKRKFSNKIILADTKIVDAGEIEANIAFKAGADIVTVLGNSNIKTIYEAKKTAEKHNKMIMLDLIEIQKIEDIMDKIELLRNHIIMIHTGYDSGILDFKNWIGKINNNVDLIKKLSNIKIAIGGGINEDNIGNFLNMSPDIIIIGRSIIYTKNPLVTTKRFSEIIKK